MYVLTLNGQEIASAGGWNPYHFANFAGTSFPSEIPDGWKWEQDGYLLQWVADPIQQPTQAQVISSLTSVVQDWMDSNAQRKGYDGIVSACSYAGAPNPFQTEGEAFLTWRGNVWAACYAIMSDVQAGNRPIPTDSELLAELPACPVV